MSTIRVNAIQDTSGVERYTARAWVNFNGTGTVAIRASGNVSSITDNGTGDYTVNFTNAMQDANYSCQLNGGGSSGMNYFKLADGSTPTSTSVRIYSFGASLVDATFVSAAIFR